ncbi:MAG: N-acetylmuramoyl-L-alanine amidase [Acidobacteria bacterium]|nr:MAG: N-acetylmuramoyl-L-alanine amidase [Acidobacteriota bacterium]
MESKWIGCVDGNFRVGRPAGNEPKVIVLHSLGGPIALATRRFHAVGSLMSCHYAIGKDGTIQQFVSESDTAFHAGLIVNPTSRLVVSQGRVNPNFYSIGVEHEGAPNEAWTESQVEASSRLIADIGRRWRIPLDDARVISHQAIRASADCPGAGCKVAKLITRAQEHFMRRTSPAQPFLRITSRCNRRLAPSRASRIVQTLEAGSHFAAVAFVQGELVCNNSFWYVDEEDNYIWAGATDRPHPIENDGQRDDDQQRSSDSMEAVEQPQSPAHFTGLGELIVDRRLALGVKDYYSVATRKDLIVLHFTAGRSAMSAIQTWKADPQHVATAYVVDMDGTIFEAFDPRNWAYHLGIRGTKMHDVRSIGIEIANVGPLKLQPDGALNWWPPQEQYQTRWCGRDESRCYVESEYRGIHHFATFPEPQLRSVAQLVRQLTSAFSIPRNLAPAQKRLEFDPSFFSNFRGIATHANFRADKWDIGPAFNWDSLGV